MWPFKTRGSRFHGDLSERSPSLLGKHDFTTIDAVIKLWLPDELVAALDVISAERDASRPDVLRWILFEHAYGRAEFAHLCHRAQGRTVRCRDLAVVAPSGAGEHNARPIAAPALGKSLEDIKLHLPAQLRRDLERLAALHRQPLSDYLRGVLARVLMGVLFLVHARKRECA